MSSSISDTQDQSCGKEATISVGGSTSDNEEVQSLMEDAVIEQKQHQQTRPEVKSEGLDGVVYSILPEADSFRYIVLEPGAGTEPLRCSLSTVSLGHAPPFEAISYVWGDPERCRRLLCDAKCLSIPRNLEEALRQVRLREEPRTLWVDMVCINQDNKKEQGHQVGLMGRIYSKAVRTLICLGPDSQGDAPVAMQIVHETSDRVEQQIREVERRKPDERKWGLTFPNPHDPVLQDPRWESVRALMQHPWFGRAWVVQEATLAREARVLWGSSETDWVEILRALYWLRMRGASIRARFGIEMAVIHRRTFPWKRPREAAAMVAPAALETAKPLGAILYSGRGLGTSDLRDKIYAFLSMPTSTNALTSIRPTYEVDYQTVYHNFACAYLRETGDLDLLQYVEHRDDDDLTALVSWVPRWDVFETRVAIPRSRTSIHVGGSFHQQQKDDTLSYKRFALVDGDRILKLRAILLSLDRVTFDNATFREPGCQRLDETKIVKFWRQHAPKRSPTDSNAELVSKSAAQSFLSTLMMGDSGTRAMLSANPLELKTARTRWLRNLRRGDDFATSGWELPTAIKKELDRAHIGRRFAVLSRGNYCLIPAIAKADDVCAIVIGARLPPLILRAASSTPEYYKVVGPAYVSGINDEGTGFCSHELGRCDLCWKWCQGLGKAEDILLY